MYKGINQLFTMHMWYEGEKWRGFMLAAMGGHTSEEAHVSALGD